MEAISHIKYQLIFDELTDKAELDKLQCVQPNNQLLLEEIVAEEKLVEKQQIK